MKQIQLVFSLTLFSHSFERVIKIVIRPSAKRSMPASREARPTIRFALRISSKRVATSSATRYVCG
jgi:hypothetical protein